MASNNENYNKIKADPERYKELLAKRKEYYQELKADPERYKELIAKESARARIRRQTPEYRARQGENARRRRQEVKENFHSYGCQVPNCPSVGLPPCCFHQYHGTVLCSNCRQQAKNNLIDTSILKKVIPIL